jgi:uncharacterized protein (TIGR00255 family)
MIKSMTGFGRACGNSDGVEFTIEIKSVNNRYLKISQRMGEMVSSLEAPCEQTIRRRLSRGSVSMALRVTLSDEKNVAEINSAALESYLRQLRDIEADPNPTYRIDLATLLQLPGVMRSPETSDVAEAIAPAVAKTLGEAIDNMIEMRAVEGVALGEELIGHIDLIESHLDVVAAHGNTIVDAYYDRLSTRVAELTEKARVDIDQDILAREVALMAERSDITEELVRLKQHLKEFRRMVNSDDAVGRKLDFLAQELLREANTIGSTSVDVDIAQRVVDIKAAIDRIKEQAANIE